MTKRAFDVLFALSILLLTGPIILIAALAVRVSSPGPVLYRARRAGQGGRPFAMLKLRTMRVGADTPERRVTDEADDRITPVGRLLRKFEIDELPQFWNVLRGDMSVVGPRPEDYSIVEQFYTPEQRGTLRLRPGVVSPADVRWYPDITYHDPPPPGVPLQEWYLARHMPVMLAEALVYTEQRSFWLDLQVIMQTAFCILVRSWLLPPARQPQPLDRLVRE